MKETEVQRICEINFPLVDQYAIEVQREDLSGECQSHFVPVLIDQRQHTGSAAAVRFVKHVVWCKPGLVELSVRQPMKPNAFRLQQKTHPVHGRMHAELSTFEKEFIFDRPVFQHRASVPDQLFNNLSLLPRNSPGNHPNRVAIFL